MFKFVIILTFLLIAGCGTGNISKRGRSTLTVTAGSSYSFGIIEVGATPNVLLTVQNAGVNSATGLTATGLGAPIDYTGGSYPGTAGTCGTTLNIAQTCVIDVTFTPVANGSSSATLSVSYSSGGASQTLSFSLSGYGKISGSLDTTFGTSGYATMASAYVAATFNQSKVQSDGSIVSAGTDGTWFYSSFVARYSSAGAVDTSVGGGTGWVGTCATCAAAEGLGALVIQPDGKIVVGGASFDGVTMYHGVVRYLSDFSLDTSFNTTGKVAINDNASWGADMAIQPDGKLVVVGQGGTAWSISRLNTDGSLDTSLNGTGSNTSVLTTNDALTSVAVQADGMLAVAGKTLDCCSAESALGRYDSTGILDTGFNATGYLVNSFNPGPDTLNKIVQQSDGKLLAVGYGNSGVTDVVTIRTNTDGTLDTSYNATGTRRFSMGYTTSAQAVALDSNGKIVIAGNSNNGSSKIYLARLNTDGSYDTTFAGVGYVEIAIGTNDSANDILIMSDGKYLVSGYATIAGVQTPVILKVWY